MSAWLCSQEHINLLVNASENPCKEDFDMLVEENLRSLTTRYPGRDFLVDWINEAGKFRFSVKQPDIIVSKAVSKYRKQAERKMLTMPTNASQKSVIATLIVKACNCYDYQACETEDYHETPAAKYVERLRTMYLSDNDCRADGALYEALPWGI